MCLSEGGHDDYTRLARAMDDERLRQLDCYYRNELGLAANTAEMALLIKQAYKQTIAFDRPRDPVDNEASADAPF